jgi:hypothetical protein
MVVGLLGMLAVAGCTTTSPGHPAPATTVDSSASGSSPSTGGEDLPFAGAPKVADSLDTNRFHQDPCQTLTADQAQDLNVPPSGELKTDTPLGNACLWRNKETGADAEIHFSSEDPRGLSAMYDTKDEYAYFEELSPIDGYPAVATDILDDRDIGRCTVVVGRADEITFDASVQLSEANVGKKDPCEAAVQVAGMALKTMKSGT